MHNLISLFKTSSNWVHHYVSPMIDRHKRISSPKRSIRSQGSLHGFPAHQTQRTVLPTNHDPLSNKASLEV